MATERAANGEIPVEALLAQLRRAAEQDGVEDVDAVVAEFATFVRAQAPRIAAQRAGRRTGMSWSGALLTAGALSVAVFGAVASGLVTNPFLPSTPSFAEADGTDDTGDTGDALVLAGPVGSADSEAGQASSGSGAPGGTPATDAPVEPAPATEFVELVDAAPMTFTDPDALAVLAEQRSAGPTPPPSTTPVAPSATAPADAADAADATTTPTTTPATDATTTTTLPTPVLDASTGPETLVSPTPADQQQDQLNDAFTDQGGAG